MRPQVAAVCIRSTSLTGAKGEICRPKGCESNPRCRETAVRRTRRRSASASAAAAVLFSFCPSIRVTRFLPVAALLLAALPLVASSGCSGTTPKVDHPVVGPPPPRLKGVGQPIRESDVQTAMVETEVSDDLTEVVARVNGQPIFAAEVLERFSAGLKQYREQAGEAAHAQQREELLRTELTGHIEQLMLNQKLREKFGGEVLVKVEEQLDDMFGDQIADMRQKTGAKSLSELQDMLAEAGSSLASLKRSFANRQLAEFYLAETLQEVPEVKRADIVSRYNADSETYTLPADVKWQQLTVSFDEHNGRVGAIRTLEDAVKDLQAGESFDLVVGRYSDGIMKDRAGMWDYTTRGSLANKELETNLYSLAVNEISPPIKADDAFLMVRVVDRREERRVPLADVQDRIRIQIANERREQAANDLIAELWLGANVTTVFDDDPRWQDEVAKRKSASLAAAEGKSPR